MPQKTRKPYIKDSSSVWDGAKEVKKLAEVTYSIDQHSDEYGGCNLMGVRWVLLASDQLRVFSIEQKTEDTEYDDSECRYDRALKELAGGLQQKRKGSGVPRPCLHGTNDGLHLSDYDSGARLQKGLLFLVSGRDRRVSRTLLRLEVG
jgi:hypothetical protein